MDSRLGRREAPDRRDRLFTLATPAAITRTYRYWYGGAWRGDQGWTSQCVAYAWSHFYTGSPITHTAPPIPPESLYERAQDVDEWAGTDYDGTSVRAGAKIMVAEGVIPAYGWAWDAATVAAHVLTKGPMVVGINWYEAMFDPDEDGWIDVEGEVAGGHALLVDGVNTNLSKVRMLNSWGRDWGRDGRCWISMPDFDRLLHENGEACTALEAPR